LQSLINLGGGIIIDFTIQNVVASADTKAKINLKEIARTLDNIEYDPSKFPGLIYHIKEPKSAIIFFSNGKLVSTGANSVETTYKAFNLVLQKLRDIGVKMFQTPDVDVQNIVATYDLHKLLNLNAIAITLGNERVEYEPDQFEGLVYRLKDPAVVILLYSSGKIVCSGAKSIEDIEIVLTELLSDLESTGLMS
jgi:transcription initiation factor TFIID TATA-box-binding protein